MQPRVIRVLGDGVRVCHCTLCGHEFDYRPAQIRSR
jgi:hypothetical protein